MPNRFEVERAVIASSLPSSARLVMFVLGAWTDYETAAIPPDRRRSIAEIVGATGLSKHAVCEYLDKLELAGWLVRRRCNGGRGTKTGYRLMIGAPELPDNVRRFRTRKTVPPGDTSGRISETVPPGDSFRPAQTSGRTVPLRDSKRKSQTVSPGDSFPPAQTSGETVPPGDSFGAKQSPQGTRNKSHSVQVGEASVGPRSSPRGTRLPDDWKPSGDLLDWAAREYPHVDAWDQTERFTDYWLAKAGAAARHVDWNRTWKNWIRGANDKLPQQRSTTNARVQQALDLAARYQAAELKELT